MTSTVSDLNRLISEKEAYLAPLREAFDRAEAKMVIIPRVLDYKEFRI